MKNKSILKHLDDEMIKVLLKVSNAYTNVPHEYSEQKHRDSFVCSHLQYLYDVLLDKNIVKISSPTLLSESASQPMYWVLKQMSLRKSLES
ncbi:hypothetical protein FGO68_gene9561 [Halteria grandinella]|uniref:Uncharacterized protein n=1 Tax=Halteria grandinella TaxID=5974 RepID=A0A8J8SUT2_HALGN|nr:hypothetical protein FGO68_gene9561 [Halteria grandinella]